MYNSTECDGKRPETEKMSVYFANANSWMQFYTQLPAHESRIVWCESKISGLGPSHDKFRIVHSVLDYDANTLNLYLLRASNLYNWWASFKIWLFTQKQVERISCPCIRGVFSCNLRRILKVSLALILRTHNHNRLLVRVAAPKQSILLRSAYVTPYSCSTYNLIMMPFPFWLAWRGSYLLYKR